jgi:DNA-binding NarL/FixJ family response regulator
MTLPTDTSILIVDDHPLIRDALRETLLKGPVPLLVSMADSLESALEQLGESQAIDLVLLDLGIPGHHGLSALWTLREHFPEQPVAIFSADCDPATIQSALASGASGYLPKHSSASVIQHALGLILAGDIYVPLDALAAPAQSVDAAAPVQAPETGAPNPLALPTRQREIVELVAQGLSNKEICRELNISPNTVKTHLATIFETLGVRSRYEIFALVHKAGGSPAPARASAAAPVPGPAPRSVGGRRFPLDLFAEPTGRWSGPGLGMRWMRLAGRLGNVRCDRRGRTSGPRLRPDQAATHPSRCIRRRFDARHTRFHSPLTRTSPRTLNCLNPIACLIHPNTGSGITLRRR